MTFKLKEFNNKNYKPGPLFKRLIWYFISMLFFETNIPFPSKFKIFILKIFGARIYGWQIVIKPNVKIKYPWFISGGIDETNIKIIQNSLNPNGIDLSSGVEVSRGIKSNSKINSLFKKFYDK